MRVPVRADELPVTPGRLTVATLTLAVTAASRSDSSRYSPTPFRTGVAGLLALGSLWRRPTRASRETSSPYIPTRSPPTAAIAAVGGPRSRAQAGQRTERPSPDAPSGNEESFHGY
jgi:hypothetical protein